MSSPWAWTEATKCQPALLPGRRAKGYLGRTCLSSCHVGRGAGNKGTLSWLPACGGQILTCRHSGALTSSTGSSHPVTVTTIFCSQRGDGPSTDQAYGGASRSTLKLRTGKSPDASSVRGQRACLPFFSQQSSLHFQLDAGLQAPTGPSLQPPPRAAAALAGGEALSRQ